MYLAIDVGGTKTLLAIFSQDGEILTSKKIHTDPDYGRFLASIKEVISNEFRQFQINSCCCAIPGTVDRQNGLGLRFGNLDWQKVPIRHDISQLIGGGQTLVEHDAALGGLSEALLLKDRYRRVLYIAPGTGIGVAFIINGRIDSDLADNEAGHMVVLEQNNYFYTWEDLASGRALLAKYGELASEIKDSNIWAAFAQDFARGLQPLLATLQPDIVVLGAAIGARLHYFSGALQEEIKKRQNKMVAIPPITQAKKPEEAVVYGCYEFIKQNN